MENVLASTSHTISPTELAWRNIDISRSKLKASSRISTLLAGFAMVAIVELQLDSRYKERYNDPMLLAFVALACLLIVVHLTAVLISTCLLPHLELSSFTKRDPVVLQSLQTKFRLLVNMAWILSTVLGILLFLLTLIMAFWVKFEGFSVIIALCILVPSIGFLSILAIVIYRKIVTHKVSAVTTMLCNLDDRLHSLEMGGELK